MRHATPYLLILVAAVVGYLLIADGSDEGPESPLRDDAATPDPGDASDVTPLEAPGMAVRDRPNPPKRGPLRMVDPRTIPRGRIDVLPVGPDLTAIPSKRLRIDVEPTGRKDWAARLGRVDPATGVWAFHKILAGEVEIRVRGDHVIAKKQRAVVKADQTAQVTVRLEVAGALRYDVVLPDETRPKQVTLTLYDGRDRPVNAWFEERGHRRAGKPRFATSATQGPQGAVFGVPPGAYRLRAVSESGAWDDAEVDLVGGQTVPVTFQLGR
jgi:hypothetical protein